MQGQEGITKITKEIGVAMITTRDRDVFLRLRQKMQGTMRW